jgi:hypothetical protein
MLTVAPNMFPGFQGLYYYIDNEGYHKYFSCIQNSLYYTTGHNNFNIIQDDNILRISRRFPSFDMDLNGSKIFAIVLGIEIMLYQKGSNGQFRKLFDIPEVSGQENEYRNLEVDIIDIPDRNGRPLPLIEPEPRFVQNVHSLINEYDTTNHDDILNILNNMNYEQSISIENTLFEQSYTALVSRLYGLDVKLPQYLIINDLKINFILFHEITDMLTQNQIEKYIIDPSLQPWAGTIGTQYRIFTFFAKNGMTYLVKALYNQASNQIYL